ncbi:hypothetical protein CL634_06200 [bacterium]|nr:hypothetical protein [bacterium]
MDYFEMWENGTGPMQDPISKILREQERQEVEPMEQEEMVAGLAKTEDNEFFMGDLEIPSESRGLGDTVAKITKATGVKKMTDAVFGAFNKDCGCRERQGKLNKMFPYKNASKPRKTKGFFE